jgi:ABC-type branched-subunit amino acid transport system substrate-binding protein
MGIGVADSVSFILERRKGSLLTRGIDLELFVLDDEGDTKKSLSLAQQAIQQDIVCVIGPCDSASTYEILNSKSCSSCAFISPLATASILTRLGAPNFFRLTQ